MDVSSLTPRGPLGGCFSHQIPALTSVLKACFFAPGGGLCLKLLEPVKQLDSLPCLGAICLFIFFVFSCSCQTKHSFQRVIQGFGSTGVVGDPYQRLLMQKAQR